MARSTSYTRLFIIGLIGLVVIAVPLVLIYLYYDRLQRDLNAGERAQQEGVKALEAGHFEEAEKKCEEAVILSDKVLKGIEDKRDTDLKDDERQKLVEQQGRALWLKATAMRDRAFARAASEGSPLKETPDTTLNVNFRSVLSIPDPKERGEAVVCLRRAAMILSGAIDVQREALRTETMITPVSWTFVERFARQELAEAEKKQEDGTRPLYQLALFNYEQPEIDAKGVQRGPKPMDKRSEKRMYEAREYLDKLKKSPNARYWRNADLDAQVTLWLRDNAAAKGKVDTQVKEAKRLTALLDEARAKSRDKEQTAKLSIFDLRGLLHLRRLDLEDRTRATLRQGDPLGIKAVEEQTDEIVALCQKFAAPEGVDPRDALPMLEECVTSAARALSIAQPVTYSRPGWKKWLPAVLEMAEPARGKVVKPAMYGELVRLLDSEAQLRGRQKDEEARKKYSDLATKWLEDGIATGKKEGLTDEQLMELQLLQANRIALRGGSKKELEPHLAVLRKIPNDEARAYVLFIEGVALERQGRLEQAKLKIEEAQQKGLPALRADLALSNLYLVLNRPTQALACLNRLSQVHDRLDQLPELERAWAREFLRSREDLDTLRVVANLNAALREAAEFARRNPGKPLDPELTASSEKEANRLLVTLPRGSAQRRSARLAFARYLIQMGRREEAGKAVETAAREYPDDLDVLQAQAALLLLPSAGAKPNQQPDKKQIAQVDEILRAFVKKNPDNRAAHLLWASWLSRTERGAEAVKYLEDPDNFPGDKDDRYKAVKALALLGKGDREGSAAMLKQLPPSANIEAALVALAESPAEQSKKLDQALGRYEKSALLRCMQGASALNRNDPEQAAEAFYQALEYTQVRGTAENGLGRALALWITKDPEKARERIAGMLVETPNEKVLYLGYAYASLLLDDVGGPADVWGPAKNMSSALKAWEPLWIKESGDQIGGPLTSAEFWGMAGREDLAWSHAQRALDVRADSVPALRVAAVLAIASPNPARLAEAEPLLVRLEKALPDSPVPLILRAKLNLREQKRSLARQNLTAALKKEPDNVEAAALLGQVLLDEKDLPAATSHARAWRKRSPESFGAARLLVRVLAQDGKVDEARGESRTFSADRVAALRKEQAKAKRPQDKTEEDWKKAQADAVARLELDLKVDLASSLVSAGAYPAAEAVLKEVLDKEPDNQMALQLQGDAALGRQDWKAAADAYERAYQKNPRNLVAVNNLAWLAAEKLSDPKKALALVEEMQKGRNGQPYGAERLLPDALDTIGVVYTKVKDVAAYAKMRELFEAAERRHPTDPRMSLYLGHAYVGLDDVAKGRRAYAAAIQKSNKEGVLTESQRKDVKRQAEEALKRLGSKT